MSLNNLKITFAMILLFSLAGCQEKTITLLGKDSVELGHGTIQQNGVTHVLLNNKEYAGNWKSENIWDEKTAQRHRLDGSRPYEAYLSGISTDQVRHGHAVLTSQDGTEIFCDATYQSQPVIGKCIIGGESYELLINQLSEETTPHTP